jgi:hypothetical protein
MKHQKRQSEAVLESGEAVHAIKLLKEDHKKVKQLFERFEKTEGEEKMQIAQTVISDLKAHDAMEMEIFYPAARQKMEDSSVMNEAEEEHHVVQILLGELEQFDEVDERFEAKFMVLAENVKHHIKEEEDEMLSKIEHSNLDFEALGREMLDLKQELQQNTELPEGRSKPKNSKSRRKN